MRAAATLIVAKYLGQTLTPEVASALVAEFPAGGRPIDLAALPVHECGRLVLSAERASGILAELDALHVAQWAETERYMRDAPMDPDVEGALLDEQEGRMVQLTTRDRDTGAMVGHMRMYLTRSRHTRKCIAVEDTLYLLPEYRAGRNALRQLQHMEACMRPLGVTGIYLDDKVANPGVGRLLDHLGYQHIANRRFKSLEDSHVRT